MSSLCIVGPNTDPSCSCSMRGQKGLGGHRDTQVIFFSLAIQLRPLLLELMRRQIPLQHLYAHTKVCSVKMPLSSARNSWLFLAPPDPPPAPAGPCQGMQCRAYQQASSTSQTPPNYVQTRHAERLSCNKPPLEAKKTSAKQQSLTGAV